MDSSTKISPEFLFNSNNSKLIHKSSFSPNLPLEFTDNCESICSGKKNDCNLYFDPGTEKYITHKSCKRGTFCTELRIIKHNPVNNHQNRINPNNSRNFAIYKTI